MQSQGTLEVMMLARHADTFNGTGCPTGCEPPRGVETAGEGQSPRQGSRASERSRRRWATATPT